tara:strand:+ start:1769 stop:2161 length:393 start_codon:yes stop_codon:yes gene_type:complete
MLENNYIFKGWFFGVGMGQDNVTVFYRPGRDGFSELVQKLKQDNFLGHAHSLACCRNMRPRVDVHGLVWSQPHLATVRYSGEGFFEVEYVSSGDALEKEVQGDLGGFFEKNYARITESVPHVPSCSGDAV